MPLMKFHICSHDSRIERISRTQKPAIYKLVLLNFWTLTLSNTDVRNLAQPVTADPFACGRDPMGGATVLKVGGGTFARGASKKNFDPHFLASGGTKYCLDS